jgi:hypothetical protein
MDESTSSRERLRPGTPAEENTQIMAESSSPQQSVRLPAAPATGPASGASTSTVAPFSRSVEVTAIEHRQVYGTAKTENLRDSGAWRIILPTFVILLCLALLAVPLIILIPLFVNSLDVTAQTHGLVWLWIVMIILEVAIAAFIIRGLVRIFMTQAGNYRG